MFITTIFCEVDDFCVQFDAKFNKKSLCYNDKYNKKTGKKRMLCISEVITILILFHFSHYRTLKHYYKDFVKKYLKGYFPHLVSYNRFVELEEEVSPYIISFLKTKCKGKSTNISIIDSTPLKVCHNRRIHSHKVFKELADRGKTSTGWFYGFKLHLIINENGEIINFVLTPGNIDDRNEEMIDKITKNIFGKLIGDKGYISKKLTKKLLEKGIYLLTKFRKNMKDNYIAFIDKLILDKRGIIETVNGLLKNDEQIEHTRHRSFFNFLSNLFAGLAAYLFREKKPCLNLDYTRFFDNNKNKLCLCLI